MQHIDQSVLPVFRILVFCVVSRLTVVLFYSLLFGYVEQGQFP